jgi:uncharacterized membrane protein
MKIHRVLSVFPLGLLATSFFFDLGWLATGRAELGLVAWWLIFGGVIGSVLASITGIVALVRIPRGTRARVIGAWHGGGTLVVALLFAASWVSRRDMPGHPKALEIALSALGVLLTVITGWLGSEAADRLEEV